MGTHGVATVRELESKHRAAGQTLVAAPVLGRPDLAASGQLGIVVAGPDAAVARCTELLKVMGRRIFVAGAKPESATAIKLANNAVLGCAMVAMAEGFALVRKYGVQPQVFQDVMTEGLFAAPAYKVYGQKMVDESYDQVGSPIFVGLKDANLIAAAADLARVPMPSHNVYHDRLLGAVAHGDGERDQAGARARAGARVGPRVSGSERTARDTPCRARAFGVVSCAVGHRHRRHRRDRRAAGSSNSSFEILPSLLASQRAKMSSAFRGPFGPAGRDLTHAATSSFDSDPFLSLSSPSNVGGVKPAGGCAHAWTPISNVNADTNASRVLMLFSE